MQESYGFTESSMEKSTILSENLSIANTWLRKSITEPQVERTTSDPSYSLKVQWNYVKLKIN
jgi:hypothetical protein